MARKRHINKILPPTQSRDNPAHLFLFMCFSFPENSFGWEDLTRKQEPVFLHFQIAALMPKSCVSLGKTCAFAREARLNRCGDWGIDPRRGKTCMWLRNPWFLRTSCILAKTSFSKLLLQLKISANHAKTMQACLGKIACSKPIVF